MMNNNKFKNNLDKNLITLIKDYYNGKLSLYNFETQIINFPITNISEQTESAIDEIQEDIAYTKISKLTEEDKQNKLMSENNLKDKLKKYIIN